LRVGRSEGLQHSEMAGVLDAIVDGNDRCLVYIRSKALDQLPTIGQSFDAESPICLKPAEMDVCRPKCEAGSGSVSP
jgi:hypothetical protein